ncbi:ubiquinone biosynthesis hydroxylase [Breoghania sp.]|uniref:ubiquinone biosynthesis hydroxylase n=1 Tax=Breoghania sp. TaxID=2065378 RepID=UPI002612D181|nr:ubiquinone biosynthesis hydroxylase [Breoghania sp.]MDJ0931658.1 ubiquinone biosynthesis hydroxylase [Breoghania sp.]
MTDAQHETETLDVLVAGGYVGLSLALALKASDPDIAVAVVDTRPRNAISKDLRCSAIASAAERMLTLLGVWQEFADRAQPIKEMIITDSRLRDAVRPVFLTFSGEVEAGEPFAHMVANADMVGALHDKAVAVGVEMIAPDSVTSFETKGEGVEIELASGEMRTSRLLVAADGVRSRLRDLAGISTVRWEYGQSSIVCTVERERPHEGRAEEHFLPSGPFAILPLTGNRSSLVWSEKTSVAETLVKGDDFTFEMELERRFGHHLGKLKIAGGRHAYPLSLTLARDFIKPRFALVGDAAHGIHPISGQGLNLGFRDAAALAEVIVEARRLGRDISAFDVLEQYARWRRFDTFQMGVVTDVLNRLFSNESDILRAARDFGLGLVDRMPGMKRMFIREAAGLAGQVPRLLTGETI